MSFWRAGGASLNNRLNALTAAVRGISVAVLVTILPRLQRGEPCSEIGVDDEHGAVDDARAQALAMLADCSGPFEAAAEWRSWRWNPAWPMPCLPRRTEAPGPASGPRS
ncbi:hypothetical protein OG936_36180 [Streptomyces sp. NBC_00846]|uniref:hypothetical protein n=1 Tax=Streptomyces sp. NBC_00846 TaxID=2975849 RepID=UPI00386542A1|nr:hypothetical protein OG936_36180 [Streptomyces sp. NBC_00846]